MSLIQHCIIVCGSLKNVSALTVYKQLLSINNILQVTKYNTSARSLPVVDSLHNHIPSNPVTFCDFQYEKNLPHVAN